MKFYTEHLKTGVEMGPLDPSKKLPTRRGRTIRPTENVFLDCGPLNVRVMPAHTTLSLEWPMVDELQTANCKRCTIPKP